MAVEASAAVDLVAVGGVALGGGHEGSGEGLDLGSGTPSKTDIGSKLISIANSLGVSFAPLATSRFEAARVRSAPLAIRYSTLKYNYIRSQLTL